MGGDVQYNLEDREGIPMLLPPPQLWTKEHERLKGAVEVVISVLDNAPTRHGSEDFGGLTWNQCKALAEALRVSLG